MGVPGVADIISAADAWTNADGLSQDEKKEKCAKIAEAIVKGAEPEHDLFNGLRLFAKTMQSAVDTEDEAQQLVALDKALAMRPQFDKALNRLVKKIAAEQMKILALKQQQDGTAFLGVEEAARLKAQEAAATKAQEGSDSEDIENDPDFDIDDGSDDIGDDNDEF